MSEPSEERFADDAHRYRLDSRIATGGMGEVWRGTDMTLGRGVAVKLLKHEYADDASFRSRFETEARHAASLHHPGVAAVYDFGEASPTDGSSVHRPYLVMELVDGQPLSALLRPGEPMDPVVTRDLLAQAADAMGAAHAAGIVHRDIKPANLLVTPQRQVKITDFGIARAADGVGLTQTGQVMGTPQYLSPEQARGTTATPASDVYSLGCVAFECLAGRRPYVAESPIATALAHLRDPIPELPDSVPADLAAVVHKALAKEPAERYADGAAFAAALRDPATAATAIVGAPATGATQVLGAGAAAGAAGAAAGAGAAGAATGATPTPAPTPEPTDRRAKKSGVPWLLIGAVALLLVVVLGILAFARGGDETPTPDTPTPKPTKTRQPSQAPTSTAPSTAPPSRSPSQAPTSQSPSETPTSSAPTTPSSAPTSSAPTSSSPTTATSSAAASQPPATSSSSPISSSSPSPATSDGASPTTANGKAAR